MEEKSQWDSYVGMNQGYNAIFDNWQNILDVIPSKTNKEINMALSLLDSALDSVKASVKKSMPEVVSTKSESNVLEVKGGDESSDAEEDAADEKEDKKSGGLFKIFGGKK